MRRAIFPGSFDPFTRGHHDIVMRGLNLFDEIVVCIGNNYSKKNSSTAQERQKAIQELYADEARVKVIVYECLTIDLAKQYEAEFILRGVRSVQDFEYERQIAEANKQLGGIETILLYTRPEYAHISSSLVRELQSYGKDVSCMLAKK